MRNFLKIETYSLTKREFLFTNFDNAENKTNQKNINMFLFLLEVEAINFTNHIDPDSPSLDSYTS